MDRDDPKYQEFDDVDLRHYPYVGSSKARAAIKKLVAEHGLGFLHNPGGGQFTCIDTARPLYGFNCQISTNDDVEDLDKLRSAIARALEHHRGHDPRTSRLRVERSAN